MGQYGIIWFTIIFSGLVLTGGPLYQEHAERVLDYMKKARYTQAEFILSHNDADHFDGLPYLIEAGVISRVYTLLLLKYKKELLKLIGDGRVTEDSLTRKIQEKYDNIYSLSGKE